MAEPGYSTIADGQKLYPRVDEELFNPASATADWAALAIWARSELEGMLGTYTATPITDAGLEGKAGHPLEAVKEVEACLVIHRRHTALYASQDHEAGEVYRASWRARALGLLGDIRFPASANKPRKSPIFDGSHDLTVTVAEGFTAGGRYVVQCNKAGTNLTAGFQVWDSVRNVWHPWPKASDPFPTRNLNDDPLGIHYQLQLAITAVGSTDFSVLDAWEFRTFAPYRRKMRRGLRMADVPRSGS